jgi:hypothetical protein
VYIHADECVRYDGDGFPADLRGLRLTFEAVAAGPRVVALARTEGGDVDAAIEGLLDLPGVDVVHVRNTDAGCFVARAGRRQG